jgi:hypothetical protein
VPFLHVGKTGRIGVDARIGGAEDVPATEDDGIVLFVRAASAS